MKRNVFSLSTLAIALPVAAAAMFAVSAGCGSTEESTFLDNSDFDATIDPPADASAGDSQPRDFGDTGSTVDVRQCVNLECNQVKCQGGQKTTLTGTVYDPAGNNPLYNALVYVPNGTVEPFDDDAGITCDKCNAQASGAPLVTALTGSDGKFVLEDVPADVDFPLVIQLGKWRRQVTIPKATACVSTALTDVGLTRLPRNQSEGHIPKMAIATGGADPFECLLRKIGIDDVEFTLPSQNGRIHFYRAEEGVNLNVVDAGGLDASTPAASSLWSQSPTMHRYDIVMLPCEGGEENGSKTDAGRGNVAEYVNAGGRLFVTHYAYTWLQRGPAPLPSVAQWEHHEGDRSDRDGAAPVLTTQIETTFPKGQAFADWLQNVDAAIPSHGNLPIAEWRHDVRAENNPPSQRWIKADTRTAWPDGGAPDGSHEVVQHFTFNTPIDAGVDDAGEPLECGRVVFSDFHVSASQRIDNQRFPASCKTDPMTPQEKALEFMLFDLSACIQPDVDVPVPPPPIPR